ncbi:MAG: DNA-processing protein DprA, partial [Candidatus Subteraquimicrobiales bacterium]|nr:DNA-processing protein DprA [Candidatus Subteraquimicrobiales bacterium]
MSGKKFWLGLKLIPELNKNQNRLLSYFKTPENIWKASFKDLIDSGIISLAAAQKIVEKRVETNLEKELDKLNFYRVSLLTINDPDYPSLLREISSPPAVLFTQGRTLSDFGPSVAIVGSRRASLYGKNFAYELARDLSESGVTIVSGLARGIDTASHNGALLGKGSTIGVTGCGLNIVYPPENKKLYEEIEKKGVLISDFPFGTPPLKQNFPSRNRIISGLSLGVIIVEASERSGALITADFALEQGRDVMAVPGNVKSNLSKGVHKLLKQGAFLIENADDVFDVFNLYRIKKINNNLKNKESLSDLEERIIEAIG